MTDGDEVLEFNFGGVEPAVMGSFVTLPKGEYNLQCIGAEKFISKKTQQPGIKFTLSVTNHPTFEGTEHSIWHMLGEKNAKFLLNTLMCLIPEKPWQQDGIKVPLSVLCQQVQGRPCNGIIDWEVNSNEGKSYVNNSLKGLKAYDASITPPVATEGNPPVITNTQPSATTTAASAGVPQSEVEGFLSNWPGGTTQPPAPATGPTEFGSPLEPF